MYSIQIRQPIRLIPESYQLVSLSLLLQRWHYNFTYADMLVSYKNVYAGHCGSNNLHW